jgi:uncharacterized cupredoxin-like copper-binding protein
MGLAAKTAAPLVAIMIAPFVFALAAAAIVGPGSVDDAAAGAPHADTASPDAVSAMDAATVLHHWQALTAIREGNVADARHHVEQVIAAVEDETHVGAMREVLAALNANDTQAAEHGIETMIAGRAEAALDVQVLHLQVALESLNDGDLDDATEHIGHFTALLDGESHEAQQVLDLIGEGNHEEAAEHLSELVVALSEEGEHADDEHADDDHAVDTVLEADREITLVMTEFAYEPNVIRAKVGERVRLVIVNEGVVLHDVTAEEFHGEVQTTAAVESHASDAGDAHGGGGEFHAALNGGDTAELVFEAEEAGEYELFCTVPGHRDLGMTARLIIEE